MPNSKNPHSSSTEPGWEEHNLSQLKYFRSLTLRQKLEAVEGMADIVRRFQYMRAEGGFTKASQKVAATGPAAASIVREPKGQYGSSGSQPIILMGCTPEPLGNYLKALGVFRLVAEQVDPSARAWWSDGVLQLFTKSPALTGINELVDWFLEKCEFSPLIAPWQKGTGYLPIGKRQKGGDALNEIIKSDKPALRRYKQVVKEFAKGIGVTVPENSPEKWIETISKIADDTESVVARLAKDGAEAEIHGLLRRVLSDDTMLRWLDAAGTVSTTAKNELRMGWFPLLAGGGGEASGQYIVNQQQRLLKAVGGDGDLSRAQLLASMSGCNSVGTFEAKAMGAMYYPGLMKAPNSGQGFLPDPERRVNPWDFILLLEGTLLWATASTRRHQGYRAMASFPFFCRSSFGGSQTIGRKEVEGAEGSIANGELWCPLWGTPMSIAELRHLFSEGRVQLYGRTCEYAIEFARAICQFGIERGIDSFVRYSLLERSGSGRQTTLLAVPLGQRVPKHLPVLLLLEEMNSFLKSMNEAIIPHTQQPERLIRARRNLEETIFEATSIVFSPDHSEPKLAILEPLIAASRIERELAVTKGKIKYKQPKGIVERRVSPVLPLSQEWFNQLEKMGVSNYTADEVRFARAIATIAPWGETEREGRTGVAVEAIRANLLPVTRLGNSWQWNDKSHSAVWERGASLSDNLTAVLRRRLIDSTKGKGEGLPLWSGYGARFSDLLALLNREIDEARLTDLIHALALIDTGQRKIEKIDAWRCDNDPTPDLHSSSVWFDAADNPHVDIKPVTWRNRLLLAGEELRCAFELPRVYPLLKLCFVGGRLPARPVEGQTVGRTGEEPYPPAAPEILNLLQAGRLSEAIEIAARKLKAKGYSPIFDPRETSALEIDMNLEDCRRLAGMLLIPVRHAGVLAAIAIQPRPTTN